MKGIIETFVGCIYLVLVVFTISSFSVAGMQIMMARHYHTSIINQIQASYYEVDINEINKKHKISQIQNINGRKSRSARTGCRRRKGRKKP